MARRNRQSTSRPNKIGSTGESKRLEAESARLTELQESLRVRKETLKVAYEEIKILREDLLREGETMDKNKSHFLSPEDTEEIRRLEQQELAFWRGSASKRLAGWTRDGSTEDWVDAGSPETQQRSRSKEEKTARDARKGVKQRCQNGRCHGWFGWLSVVMRGHTRILQAIFECEQHAKENVFGTVERCDRSGVIESVELECGWIGRRMYRYFPVADGVNVGAHELFTPSELMGELRCLAVIVNRKWKGQSKIVGGAARWTAVELDGQLTLISAHLPHKGRKLGEFEATLTELQEFLNGRPKQHVILGGDFNVNLFGMTDYLHVGESIPRTENVDRHKRLIACESSTHDGDRTGFDGDKHVDECRHRTRAFHALQLVKPRRLVDTNGLHHDFEKIGNETCAGSGLRLVQDRSQSGVCSSFVETENEVHGEEYCKLAWLGARRILARCGCSNFDRLEELEKLAPLLVETAKAHRKVESKEMSVTEMELKTLLLRRRKQVDTSNDQN